MRNKVRTKRKTRRITPMQTHIRVYKSDKNLFKRFMQRKNVKSEAEAFRLIVRGRK